MLVKAYESGKCQISIYTDEAYCQSSEILVDVVIQKCASKLCFQCKGPYEADWLQWVKGMELNSNGSWLPETNKIPTTNSMMYWIWGMITMIVTLIYLLLSLKYGKIMLLPILHLQTFIICSSSTPSDSYIIDVNLKEYLSWIDFTKFDLWYLTFGYFESSKTWTANTSKLK